MHIPLNVLDKMPVRDRKYYILRHNQITEDSEKEHTHGQGITVDGESINSYAHMEQQNEMNAQKRVR